MDLLRLLLALALGGLAGPATVSEQAVRVSIPRPSTTPYVVPVADPASAGWNPTHSTYPASDIFVAGGCGGTVVSPVDGRILEVRRVDSWTAAIDNPATRGGRSVAILGNDGVRYYAAHFDTIGDDIAVDTKSRPAGCSARSGGPGGRAHATSTSASHRPARTRSSRSAGEWCGRTRIWTHGGVANS